MVGKIMITVVTLMLCHSARAQIEFVPVQPDTFADSGGQSNAWGDYDNDGDLDLIMTFRDAPLRLYQNGANGFENVAGEVGLPGTKGNQRSIAWGDYDGDGDLDVYIGYSGHHGPKNQLFRNDLRNGVAKFTDVSEAAGVDIQGITRQISFVDYDSDGDVDLYVALRASPNRLLQNNGGVFTDVTFQVGIAEPRRTVGACWFDMDSDGDLDLFTANQNGDRDGLFRNDGGRFTDIAQDLDMDQPRRPLMDGSVGCAVTDFDTDGDLDLYVAAYGYDKLWKNNGDGTFTDVAPAVGINVHDHIVTGVWGDIQHDGKPDLYTVGYVNGKPRTPDYLFINQGERFSNELPANIATNDTDHGVQWVDFDQDGDLDLSLAANDPEASHPLYRNELDNDIAGRAIQVLVLDKQGRYTKAGAEVRIFKAGTTVLLGLRMVDTGSGYNAQNAKPVHIGLTEMLSVDVHVTTMSVDGPKVQVFENIDPTLLDKHIFEARVEN